MEYATDNDIPKHITEIEDLLEGEWYSNEYDIKPTYKYLTFIKPENSGDWGVLLQSSKPHSEEYISLEYKIVMPVISKAIIQTRVNDASKVLEINIDTLSSGREILYITNHLHEKYNYHRLKESQDPTQTLQA